MRQAARVVRRRSPQMIGDASADEPVPNEVEVSAGESVSDREDILLDTPTESEESDSDMGETLSELGMSLDGVESNVEVVECPLPQNVINARAIEEARLKFKLHETDSGSPEFQIATLTTRIQYLTAHLKRHPKDHSTTRGLIRLVSQRRRLLKFVKRQDPKRFHNLVEGLEIRISQQLRAL